MKAVSGVWLCVCLCGLCNYVPRFSVEGRTVPHGNIIVDDCIMHIGKTLHEYVNDFDTGLFRRL